MSTPMAAKLPNAYQELAQKTNAIGFTMSSDVSVGALLRALAVSKPAGNFLELGTGTGLALSWLLDGMDAASTLIGIDTNPDLIAIANTCFGDDERLTVLCEDAGQWLSTYQGKKFDLIFADAWPGKYSHLDITLHLLKKGGFYVIDDMAEQPDWPDGHNEKAKGLIAALENRPDLELVQLAWSTGIGIAVKRY